MRRLVNRGASTRGVKPKLKDEKCEKQYKIMVYNLPANWMASVDEKELAVSAIKFLQQDFSQYILYF